MQVSTKLRAQVKILERGAETNAQALQTTKSRLNDVCDEKASLVSENARLHDLIVHLTQKHQKVLRGQNDDDDESSGSDGVAVDLNPLESGPQVIASYS